MPHSVADQADEAAEAGRCVELVLRLVDCAFTEDDTRFLFTDR